MRRLESRQTFVGEYRHSLDAKNRLFIPAKFRELLGENFAIARINEKCLLLFSEEEWIRYTEKLLNGIPADTKRIVRKVFSKTTYATPDAQGRVIIPTTLCGLAELQKNVVIIGAGNHAEIWSDTNWDALEEELSDEALAETFNALGF
ncbi:MAG: division/cell wall cluster transcriptional repressor MraZ [Clostridia bacterium]|nr:division/cell wall cluster transcriptional repressor MraZ [Clostridia bacterium]